MLFWSILSTLLVLLAAGRTVKNVDICLVWQGFANCSELGLTYIPLDLSSTIYELDGSYNSIKSIQWPLPYFHVVSLNLSHNDIYQVGYHAFLHLFSLNSLDLSYNNIKYLSQLDSNVSFFYTPQLTHVILRGNPLKSLASDPIRSDSIQSLDVAECDIRSLEGETSLLFMPNLMKLVLNKNPLSKMDVLVSESLEAISMTETQLRYIKPEFYMGLPKLKILDVSKNLYLTSLCRVGTAYALNLKVLKAEFCSLEYLQIKGFPNIEELYLKGNRIDRITESDLSSSEKLVFVDLSMNWIHQIDPVAFKGAASIAKLDLSGNKILEVRDGILSFLSNLIYLNISNNPIFSIDGIETAYHLSILDASHCDIVLIPDRFFTLGNLESVNLSRNSIWSLPSDMSSFTLMELNLGYNRLTEVHDSWFKHFPRLKSLSLEGNRLTEPFHPNTLRRLNHVKLHLDDNPWRCNCKDDRYRNFHAHLSNSTNQHSLTCHGPANVTGMSWEYACFQKELDMRFGSKKKNAWLPMLLAALATLGIIILLYFLRKKSSNRFRYQTRQSEPAIVNQDATESHRTPPRHEAHLPSYEEALLMPKPKITTKSNADTQTQVSFLGSVRSLDSRAKHLTKSPSSNSL